MRKANTQKSDTHTRIIDAAGTLFRQHGIDGVGVDAIMRAKLLSYDEFVAAVQRERKR